MLDAVRRSSERAATCVRRQMMRGSNTLTTIAVSAPFVGVLGTLIGIYNYPVAAGERWGIYAMELDRLAQALMPTELSLFVALLAFGGSRYILAKVEALDAEMVDASFELLNRLGSWQEGHHR
jgi:biopolymer transport protein ExbB/TolQ